MRVLMLTWEYPPHLIGGLGKHIADLLPVLAAEGVEVVVLTPRLRGGAEHEIVAPGAQIFRARPPYVNGHGFISQVEQTNRELEQAGRALYEQFGGFDLIHNHDWLTTHAAITLKQEWRIPMVATVHSTERGRRQGMLSDDHARRVHDIEWQLTYEAWRVIVCSHFMAAQMTEYFHTPPDKIDAVPNGVYVPPDPFRSVEERLAFRRRYVADEQRLAFYVGRIVYEKGLQVLLDAWHQVLAQVPTRLVIAGTGPYLNSLRTQAERLGLQEHVLFPGFVSDEERDCLYHVADVAAFPSLYEPFGIVALEAFAAECPVVVSQTGGLMEVVRHHETGIIVYPGSAGSLAWGILHTLQHPDWSQARVMNALNEVRDNYNWRHIARSTIAVYNQVYEEWLVSSWRNAGITR
jgi:glycosyltransferase involved in cell wall biosynthesis